MRHNARIALCLFALTVLAVTACSRSGDGAEESGGSGGTSATGGAVTADFGTTTVACGPNKTGEALGSPDQGVTGDSIHVATISDVGFTARPGLNQELFDASDVFAKWCNDLGGINGRKIVIDKRDAALTNYKPMIIDSCTTDLALVGGGGVFDDSGQVERLKCLLPNFPGYVVSTQARDSDLTYQAVPNPAYKLNIGGVRWLKQKFPDSMSKVAVVYGNIPTLKLVQGQFSEAFEHEGATVVDHSEYNPLGESSWTPIAQNLKSKGVKGVMFVGEPTFLGKFLQAMATIDYTPEWVFETANMYDQQLIDEGGDAVRNVYITLMTTPYLADNAAMDKYKALFERYLPKGKKEAVLGQNSFSSWILFAQVASACGADLTRKCLVENAQKVTEFDAGGFQAPADPATATPTDCFTLVTVKDRKFAQVDVGGDKGVFSCDKANLLELKGDYGKGVTLADAGKSLSDLP